MARHKICIPTFLCQKKEELLRTGRFWARLRAFLGLKVIWPVAICLVTVVFSNWLHPGMRYVPQDITLQTRPAAFYKSFFMETSFGNVILWGSIINSSKLFLGMISLGMSYLNYLELWISLWNCYIHVPEERTQIHSENNLKQGSWNCSTTTITVLA